MWLKQEPNNYSFIDTNDTELLPWEGFRRPNQEPDNLIYYGMGNMARRLKQHGGFPQ